MVFRISGLVKIWILTLLLIMAGCTDVYHPDIDQVDSFLVVEGLLTDQAGPHLVKLTRSSTFGKPFPRMMVTGAKVTIISDSESPVMLEEKQAGHYYTPPDYKAQAGESYTLHIESPDGQHYRSREQTLMPPLKVENVTAELGNRPFYLSSGVSSTITEKSIAGGKVFVSFSGQNSPKFRFTSQLLLDYFILYPGIIPTMDYCWIKRSILDYLDKDIGQGFGSGVTGRHQVGFIPAIPHALPYMGFPDYINGPENTFYGSVRIILNHLYALNDDAFRFHDMRNKQLGDEGRFFDPIAAQLPGNISNINNPDEPVLGLFEVSSVSFTPVLVKLSLFEISAEIINIVDTIPAKGCLYEEIPVFFRGAY